MSVRLCMLARDEEEQIRGVAEAVGDLVDDYCVLIDERTIDETADRIRAELGDEGDIQTFRFEDFAQARNELFSAARPGADYLLLVDPDSPPRGLLPDPLEAPLYDCTWRSGVFEWRLPILVDADLPCRYVGACHELLVAPVSAVPCELVVDVPAKPPRPGRFELYVELLRPTAEQDPRSAFYLAQSLRDLGRRGEAIEAYLRRAQMGHGWVEETFLSLVEAGVLLLALDAELARVLLERARDYRPSRLEPLYWLAWLANAQGRRSDAARLALDALDSPPSSDSLFVNRYAERAGVLAELEAATAALGSPSPTIGVLDG